MRHAKRALFVMMFVATAAATGALLAWARRKPWLAGALIGLGVAAKLYPLLLFVPLVILGMRTGRLRDVGRAAVATVATWLLVRPPGMCRMWNTSSGSPGVLAIE